MARTRVMATVLLLWTGVVVALAAPSDARTPGIVPNGAAVTATISGPSDVATFAFAATSGDTVNLTASNGTFAGGCDAQLQIADSHGRILVGPACAGSTAFFGSVVLPGTGTYLVQLVAGNGNPGSVMLRLSRNAAASTIAENGPPVTFTATKVGQGRDFAFSGTDADVVNLTAAAGTYANSCDVLMQIVDNHGRGIAGPVCAGSSAFLGSIILPGTGPYLVKVIPGDGNTGSVTLKLSKNAAPSTIAENGPPVTFTATKAGQGRDFAFTGTDGDVVNLSAAAGTYANSCDVLMQIVDNHGRGIAGPVCAGSSAFLGSITLPGTGGYLVKVLPGDGNTGSVTLKLSRNAVDSTITVGGSVTFTATKPGQGRNYAFTGSAGDVVNLSAAGGTYANSCDVLMQIVDDHGRGIAGPACAGSSAFLGSVVLPGTGPYLVKVVPGDGNTGSVTLKLSRNDPDATIAVGGSVTFTATKPGQGRNYAFTANDGESVDLTASGGTYPGNCDVHIAISDSYGRILSGPACGAVTGSLTATILPGTGTYLVQIIPSDGVTGSVTLHLDDTP